MVTNNRIIENSKDLLSKLDSKSEKELAKLIRYHNRKYFEENNPEITDEAFDKLVEGLRFLNPRASVLMEIGPKKTKRDQDKLGADVVHKEPMLSLEKCYDEQALLKWIKKIAGGLIAMPKIDGVACSLTYGADGSLTEAATRGDGRVGENITKNAQDIPDIPKNLVENGLEVRGEVFLPITTFKQKFGDSFTSPRNLAAGFLKLKEAPLSKISLLKFFPYDLRGAIALDEREKFLTLERLGFSMMPWALVDSPEAAIDIYRDFMTERSNFDYEIDGVVYRANSLSEQLRLGETAHHPRFALAYKFYSESLQTKLVGVEWSVARSGIITPVAIVEPVFVSGASISRASLHNLRIFRELDLREDSLVEINRRGGVIPHLERVLSKKGRPMAVPTKCPSCGGFVVVNGDFLRCKNKQGCEKIAVSNFVHFCRVLGIEGMGEKIIRRLFQAGMINRLADLYRLDLSKLLSLPRIGEVLAAKLVEEVNKKRSVSLSVFLEALGIREVGGTIAQVLANNFSRLDALLAASMDELLAIDGIGLSIATSLREGLEENLSEIKELKKEITVTDESKKHAGIDPSHPLFDKSVLFTGKMAHLERKAAQDAVERIGGKAPGAMSKTIDYLVIGDEGSPLLGPGKKSTKQKEAEKLKNDGGSIKIISETEFLNLLKK